MTAYCFDVDGTLTPSRGRIDPAFKQWFCDFQKNHSTYIVSGSDYDKSLEQLGPEVLAGAKMIFSCCGNEVRRDDQIIYQSPWKPSIKLLDELASLLEKSKYPVKTGKHVEIRTGLVNFSIVGRNATIDQRRAYYEYDLANNERHAIAAELAEMFPDLEIGVAGETGMDICELGANKSQILKHFDERPIVFFGDRTKPGGNDYPLACVSELTHSVEDWQHTWELLRMINP